MKRIADGEETVVLVPAVPIPVQVQVTLVNVLVEARNVAIAIRVRPNRAAILYKASSKPLLLECS